MIRISFNIGYEGNLSDGILTKYPIYHDYQDFKDFSDFIRNNAFEWILWAHVNNISKTFMCFYLTIWEVDKKNPDGYWSWEFTIHVNNIREYLPYLKMSREEVEEMKIQRSRENKLDEILNSECEKS